MKLIVCVTLSVDVVSDIVAHLGLRSPFGWAVYERSNDVERSLSDRENIGDIVAKWEKCVPRVMLFALSFAVCASGDSFR